LLFETLEENNIDITNNLLSEKHSSKEIFLPAILIIKDKISISKTSDNTIDTNEKNMNFINTLKNKCNHKL